VQNFYGLKRFLACQISILFSVAKASRKIFANSSIWLVCIIGFNSPPSHSNGWEHTAINFEVLVAALNDANPNLRRRAAESIGFRPQAGATAALLARLEQNESAARVRQEIYLALGKLGETPALDAIESCLINETDIAARAQCAAALGNFHTPAAQRLALQGTRDQNRQVRLRAIASLGSFSSTSVVRALTKFARDPDVPIKHTALLSLGRTRSSAAAALLADSLTQAEDRQQLQVLLQALTYAADPGALTAIQSAYRRSADEAVKRHALVAMASTRAAGSESYFLEALASADHASRMLGLAVLRNLGNRDQVAAITKQALLESGGLFGRKVKQLLDDPLQTLDNLQLLNAYLKTVIRLDPAAGEELYAKFALPVSIPRTSSAALKIAQGFYDARWQSIYGLGYTGTARAAELAAAGLQDSDARIRAVATRSLGVMGATSHYESIARMLFDRAAEVRWTAARVLGRSNARSSAGGLLNALNDSHAQVRLEAAMALGYLKARAAQQRLSELASTDPDSRVREAALYAASLIE